MIVPRLPALPFRRKAVLQTEQQLAWLPDSHPVLNHGAAIHCHCPFGGPTTAGTALGQGGAIKRKRTAPVPRRRARFQPDKGEWLTRDECGSRFIVRPAHPNQPESSVGPKNREKWPPEALLAAGTRKALRPFAPSDHMRLRLTWVQKPTGVTVRVNVDTPHGLKQPRTIDRWWRRNFFSRSSRGLVRAARSLSGSFR